MRIRNTGKNANLAVLPFGIRGQLVEDILHISQQVDLCSLTKKYFPLYNSLTS